MVLQIMSRAYYSQRGYAMYPEYESMYADNDFTEHARHDGVVIDARHLVFSIDTQLLQGQRWTYSTCMRINYTATKLVKRS